MYTFVPSFYRCFDWSNGLKEDVWWQYTCMLPRDGCRCAPGIHFFSVSLIFNPTAHFLQDFPVPEEKKIDGF